MYVGVCPCVETVQYCKCELFSHGILVGVVLCLLERLNGCFPLSLKC